MLLIGQVPFRTCR